MVTINQTRRVSVSKNLVLTTMKYLYSSILHISTSHGTLFSTFFLENTERGSGRHDFLNDGGGGTGKQSESLSLTGRDQPPVETWMSKTGGKFCFGCLSTMKY